LQDLVWHNSSLISLKRRTHDLIDITDEEKSKILHFFSSKLGFEKLTTPLPSSAQSKLYAILMKNLSAIEKNPVLTRALQSLSFSEYRTFQGTISSDNGQSIEDDIHDYCDKVKRLGSIRSILLLIKSLLSLVESEQSHTFHLNSQSFNFGHMFFLPGPDDLKSILGHLTEAERLATFQSQSRFVPTHGSADKIKPLEFLGPITGFVGGYFAPIDDSVHYFEGVVKGSQSESMRIGWELVHVTQESALDRSLPGDTIYSWAFDGYTGALFNDAESKKILRQPNDVDVQLENPEKSVAKEPLPDNDSNAKEPTEVSNISESDIDPRFDPFVKLLRIGIPEPAVEQRMSTSGFSDEDIQSFLASIHSRSSNVEDAFYFGDLFGDATSDVQRQSAAETVFSLGGTLLNTSCDKITLCEEPIDFESRQYTPWKVGDVVGCLVDTKMHEVRFFVNGVEHGHFNVPTIDNRDGLMFRPVANGAPGSGFQFRLLTPETFPESVKQLILDRKLDLQIKNHQATEYYSPIPSVQTFDRPQSTCLRLNGLSSNECGYLLGDSKLLEKVTSTHSFCLEISVRLDAFSEGSLTDVGQLFTLFCFTGKNSSSINRVCVTQSGAILCDMFGKQYRSHDNAIKAQKWHHISIVYSTSRSSVACVIDKIVHAMTKQSEESAQNASRMYESIFCIGGDVQFELNLPSESNESPKLDQSQPGIQLEVKEESKVEADSSETMPRLEMYRMTSVNSGWVGGLCDIRLWTASRSMQDITESSSRQALSGSEKRLCGYWRLDEGTGCLALDSAQIDTSWSPSHCKIVGNYQWRMFDPLKDLLTNPVDIETDGESNKEPHATFRSISSSNEFAIQEGLLSLSQKLYNSSTHLLGWKIGKGPRVLPSSKYYDIQLKSPGYKTICEPHVLTFLLLNSCFKQLLRFIVSPPSSLNLISSLTVSLTLLRILLANLSLIKENKLCASSLGLKYSNQNTEKSSTPFVATLLNSILGFLYSSEFLETDLAAIRELKLLIRQDSIRVIMTGFPIFFPHVSDQALLLQCLLIQKHSSNKLFPWNSFSLEFKNVLEGHVRSSVDLACLPTDPLVFFANLSPSCLNDLLSAVCDWMSTTSGEDDFVLKFLPRGSVPNLKSPLNSQKFQQEGVIQIGDTVERGKDWHYGNEDGGPSSRGVVINVFSWLGIYSSCGVTVRWANGTKNSYCYGCPSSNSGSADKCYDIEIVKSPAGGLLYVAEKEGLVRSENKKELLYTPDDVRQSLVEEVGNLTKRVVLKYMKSVAPLDWQTSRKLTWTENALVSKLSGEEVSTLYADFYQTFSLNTKAISGPTSTFASTLTFDEPESFVANRFTTVMEMLLFDIEHTHFVDVSNISTTPTYTLMSVIQSYLSGQYDFLETTSESKLSCISELEVCITPVENRLLKLTPLKNTAESSNQFLLWNWELGSWNYSKELEKSESSTSSSNPLAQARYLNVSFDPSKLGKNLSLSDDGHSLLQKSSRKWSTCTGTSPLKPKSGIYKWCVKIESLGRRGHCIFGVATEDVSTNTYLGQDSSGWGLTMNNEIYHSSRSQQLEKSLKLSTSSILEILYDSNENVLHFTDTTNQTAGTMSTNIDSGDKILYPAFSLFSPGDHIVFLSLTEATRIHESPSSNKNQTGTSEKQKISGYPSASLLNYLKMLSGSILNILKKCNENLLLDTLASPLIGASFPQLLACLSRWEYIPQTQITTPDGITTSLLSLLNYFQSETFLNVSKNSLVSESRPNARPLLDGISQLSTLLLAYLGRVASSLIFRDRLILDNHDVEIEAQMMQSVVPDRHATNVTEVMSPEGLTEWLKSPLFSHGLKDHLDGACPTNIAELLTALSPEKKVYRDDLLWEWVTKHDKVSHKFKTIGGSNFSQAIQIVLNVFFYHLGYIDALSVLVDHLDSLRELPTLQDFLIREPPVFLMQAVSIVGKILFWGMQSHQAQGLSYEVIGSRLASRARFLLELMPLKTSQHFIMGYVQEFCSNDSESLSLFLESQSILALEAESRSISDLIISFLKDNVSLVLLRVGLKTASHRALERKEGFSLLTLALSSVAHSHGWIQKVALLSHLPLAMRGDSSCLFFPSSPFARIVTEISNGYYMNGLETCNRHLKSSVRGAFYSLYSALTSELSIARSNGDIPLILLILNCWGLLIDAEDHDMLARVKIFHVIQDILEVKNDSPVPDQGYCNDNTVTRAAMKVFYLLALQIASTTDSKAPSSDLSLASPVLVRARSGPSTLSEVVFEMLYHQLHMVLSSLRVQWNEVSGGGRPLLVQLSEDNMIILNESTLLLTCVSKDSTCQKILSQPTWLSLLLEICVYCPVVCQQRALRILSDLLPLISPSELERIDQSLLPEFYVFEESTTISVWYINQLLDLSGTQFQQQPQIRIQLADEKQSDLPLSASLEVTSEVVALIRILLSSTAWQSVTEELLISYLSLVQTPESFSNTRVVSRIIATLSVLGGHVESCYPGGLVEILSTKSEPSKLGVIASSNMNSDLIELVVASDSNGHSALTPGELRNFVDATDSETRSRRSILVSQERLRGISRCPLSETSLSVPLIEVLLKTVLSMNSTLSSSVIPARSGETGDYSSVFLPYYLKFLGSRVISSIATTENTSTIIHQIFHTMLGKESDNFDETLAKSLLSLFKLGGSVTTTAGLPDISLLETHLTMLINQRNQMTLQKQIESSKSKEIPAEITTSEPTPSLPCEPILTLESGDPTGPQSSSPLSVEEESKEDTSRSEYLDLGGGLLVEDPHPESVSPEDLEHTPTDMEITREVETSMFESDWNVNPEESQPYDEEGYEDGNGLMIDQLEQMGFPRRWCELALNLCGYDLGEALNYILANGDSLESMALNESKSAPEPQNVPSKAPQEIPLQNPTEEQSSFPFAGNSAPASVSMPKDFHYSEKRNTLFPMYSLPDLGSERIGALFPGDDIVAIEEIFVKNFENGSFPQWVKVYFSDYQEESCEENEEDEYLFADDRSKNYEFAWIPTNDEGVRVILTGPANPAEGLQPLAEPPAKIFPVRYTIQINHQRGLVVRESLRQNSDTVGNLTPGAVATVIEETFDSEGGLCWRITEPFKGWIHKKTGRCEIIEVLPPAQEDQSNATETLDPKSEEVKKETPSEWELYESIEDGMEQWIGSDIYRKDDRFFGSLQGMEFKVHDDRLVEQDDESTAHNRRCRVLENASITVASKAISSLSLEVIEQKILSTTKTLTLLRSRQACLGIILRDMRCGSESKLLLSLIGSLPHDLTEPEAQQSPNVTFKTPCRAEVIGIAKLQVPSSHLSSQALSIIEILLSFIRLVLFRGEPYSLSLGLEFLALDDLAAVGLQKGLLSLESILGTMILHFLVKGSVSDNPLLREVSISLSELFLITIVKQIRLACHSNYTEHSWSDPNYYDDTDSDCLKHPNLHFAIFLTELMMKFNDSHIPSLCQIWCHALRSPCMSIKYLAFQQIASILNSLVQCKFDGEPKDELLASCLKSVPVSRLQAMCARRLWHEMEDQPAYSRFLSGMIHLLSVIKTSNDVLELSRNSPMHLGESDTLNQYACSRSVVEFDSSRKSSVQLTPYKEMKHSWTIETWIFVSEANKVILPDSSLSDLTPTITESQPVAAPTKNESQPEMAPEFPSQDSGFGGFIPSLEDARPQTARVSDLRASNIFSGIRADLPMPTNPDQESASLEFVPRLVRETSSSNFGGPEGLLSQWNQGRPSPFSGFGRSQQNNSQNSQPDWSPPSDWSDAPSTAFSLLAGPLADSDSSLGLPDVDAPAFMRSTGMAGHESRGGRGWKTKSSGGRGYGEFKNSLNRDESPTIKSSATVSKAGSLEPSYFLSSPSSYIKLQAGGPLSEPIEDPEQISNPVSERAFCLAIGQMGDTEKVFDYVIPVGKWVHLAISCDKNSETVNLYVNGELQSLVRGRFVLPQTTLGHSHLGKSFTGQVAELRIWSNSRSSEEVRRDMFTNVSQCRGLASLLTFSEGESNFTVDGVGLSSCRLKNCSWNRVIAPSTQGFLCSKFMLKETEEGEGVFGEGIGESHRVHELTGVIQLAGCLPHHLRTVMDQHGQSVCVCYRLLDNSASEIEGYIEWCELNVRCQIRGDLKTETNELEFKMVTDKPSVIFGPPEKLSWCFGLSFRGQIEDGRLRGEIEVTTADSFSPPLLPGEIRVSESSLPKGVSLTKEKSKNLEVISILEGEKATSYFVLVEVFPRIQSNKSPPLIPHSSTDAATLHHFKSEWENFINPDVIKVKDEENETKDDLSNDTWKDVLSAYEDSPIPSPNNHYYKPSDSIDLSEIPSVQSFGICNTHETVWINWIALTTTETVLYGLCSYDVASSSPKYESLIKNENCWTYSSKGKVSHGLFSENVEPIQKNDKISLEIDPSRGRAVFYRNDVLIHEFLCLRNHSSMQCPSEDGTTELSKCGLRPFVLLGTSDTTSLQTVSKKNKERVACRRIKYGSNDSFGRSSFICNSGNGDATGRGVLLYHHGHGFWCGSWYKNYQHGVQLWVSSPKDQTDPSRKFDIQPYLYENNIFIRELTSEEAKPWIDEWTKELQRAYYRGEQREGKFRFSELPKYINSEFLSSFGMFDASIPESPSQESLPTYLLKIIYQNGATVRAGIDIDQSRPIRSLNFGDVVEGYKRAVTHDGIPRYQIADGWISGKLRGGAGDPVVQVMEYRPVTPLKYRIIREDGAKIRQCCELDSPEVTVCPFGTVIEVSEKKLQEGESQPTMRLKITSPPEFVGWASEKANIVKLISDEEGAHDVSIKDEMKRRMEIRQQRAEIKELNETKRLPFEWFHIKPKVTLSGSLNASEESFFLLNKSQCNPGLKLSSDFLSVTCESRTGGRPMVLGTRGFSKGIHYWEVQVDSAQWGSVFIGVAPLDSSNWNGYGFINYRATQNSGSETLYGSYYAAGDTVGILLDMDHGTISFFKDGEDFNVGRTVVINMGVAYHSLRRNHKSSHPVLYPCFGLKSSGDQLSIRRCKWASRRGVGPISILERVLDAKNMLRLWAQESVSNLPKLSPELISKMYDAYLRWRQHDLVIITSRSGIDVAIDTRIDAVLRAAQPVLDICPGIRTGIKVRTPYGSGKIVGARLDELWYVLDSEENGAWYWTSDQLIDLIGMGSVSFDDEPIPAPEQAERIDSIAIPMMKLEEFSTSLMSTKQWSHIEDEALIQLVNTYSNKFDCDPMRIVAMDLETYRQRNGILPDRTVNEVQARYSAICVLNQSAEYTLPYLDFGRPIGGLLITQYDKSILNKFPVYQFQAYLSSSGAEYTHIKRLIFTKTKLRLWKLAVRETTVFTTPPPDEYERPDEIPEITLNRMEAQMAKQMRESLSFSDRFSKSLFGQLFSAIGDWDETALRRSFVHMQDAGQPRAFFVKFTGEGVDDHGGPYRAVFETSIGEEAEGMLDLFTPSSNAKIRTGENRDQSVFNAAYLREIQKHPFFIHFGKLMAVASRHNILVSLSLPQLIWKPLAGESLQLSDIQATDLHLLTSLQAISRNDVPSEDISDMLMQLLLSCSLPHHIASKLVHRPATETSCEANSTDRIRDLCSLINQLSLVSLKTGLHLLHKGMSKVLPTELFSILTPSELEILFCGEPDVDIPLLQKVTEYEGVSPTDE
jgi:hypothetical protein